MYQKAYVREECFGKKDIIFSLDRQQNTGQADIIKQERLPDMGYDDEYRRHKPLHVLEGTRVDVRIKHMKPTDNRKMRTNKHFY